MQSQFKGEFQHRFRSKCYGCTFLNLLLKKRLSRFSVYSYSRIAPYITKEYIVLSLVRICNFLHSITSLDFTSLTQKRVRNKNEWILHFAWEEAQSILQLQNIGHENKEKKLRIPALADCTAKEDDISAYLGFLSSPLLLLMLNFYIFNQVFFFWAFFIPSIPEKWPIKSAKVLFVNRWAFCCLPCVPD